MSDTTKPDTGDTDQSDTDTHQTSDTDTTSKTETDWHAEAQKWQALAQKHESRAKANAAAAKDLERVRRESMSEQERAAAEAADKAKHDAWQEAAAKFGHRMVIAEFRAASAGRLGSQQLEALMGRIDLTGFLTDDGDVDTAAVASFVDSLVPSDQARAFPDLGQGARGTTAASLNGDPLLRDIKSKLGIR